jgi:hypothetical protein
VTFERVRHLDSGGYWFVGRSANVGLVGEAKKVCFVVSPMSERDSLEQIHADWLVSEIIEPVVRAIPGFVVKRADHHQRTSPIDAQVMHYLLNSELVIADLSTQDPYVFYDIAIRHISGKPIIHMHRDSEKLPFDASLCESIGFSRLKPSDLRTAQSHLRQAVNSVLEEGYEVVNPISQFFGRVQVAQIASGQKPTAMRTHQSSLHATQAWTVECSGEPGQRSEAVASSAAEPAHTATERHQANVGRRVSPEPVATIAPPASDQTRSKHLQATPPAEPSENATLSSAGAPNTAVGDFKVSDEGLRPQRLGRKNI